MLGLMSGDSERTEKWGQVKSSTKAQERSLQNNTLRGGEEEGGRWGEQIRRRKQVKDMHSYGDKKKVIEEKMEERKILRQDEKLQWLFTFS